jgi:hypothetical protein
MEQKTKTFLVGAITGIAVLLLVIAGVLFYLYQEGLTIKAERDKEKQQFQRQQFGDTCANAFAHITKFNGQILTPGLAAIRGDPQDVKLQVAALRVAVEKHKRFVSHCYSSIAYDARGAGRYAKLTKLH